MKYFKILPILLCSAALFFYGCNEDKKTQEQETVNSVATENATTTKVVKADPPLKEPAQNAAGVWHYTCSLGHSGGSGSAAKCEKCGNILTHNTAYHSNTNSTTTSTSPFATPPPASNTPLKEPAQNAAGVWHYTCPQGHSGGAGSAVKCGTCQSTLTHNTAYH